MSWFNNILIKSPYHSCGIWKCCEQNEVRKINSIYFWGNIKSKQQEENPFKLIYEKTIYLEDGFDSTLTIGIKPQSQFAIGARFDIKSTGCVLYLTADTLLHLLECINVRFNENCVFPDVLTKTPSLDSNEKTTIQIISFYEQFYKIIIGEEQVKIKQVTLLSLLKKRIFIQMLIQLIERDQKKHEQSFFKLLNHFCYSKTVEESLQLSKLIYTQHFFEEMFHFHCDCIDKSFLLEFAFNFMDLFADCIPIFIETIMLNEKARYHSFSLGWPHEKLYISSKLLAKTGMYFTGVDDCVKCVFCKVNLHSWKSSDNVIHEHYKYSPYCKFLTGSDKTYNIVDGSQKELNDILSLVENNVIGEDEVDLR